MARVQLNQDSIKEAVNTADEIMATMKYFAMKFREVHAGQGAFPGGFATAIEQLGEGLNAVNALIKTYNAPPIEGQS